MATMLGFITSDAQITPKLLNPIVKRTIGRTFNNLTIDGDTSTNDMALVLANGASGQKIKTKADLARFEDGLFYVCSNLCRAIAADGEGATNRVEITVRNAVSAHEAHLCGKAIADSNLVKTALFGNDPNWGRIVCAIGYSGARFNKEKLKVSLCGTTVFKTMQPCHFNPAQVSKALHGKIVEIAVDLGAGKHDAVIHTCDFSYDYVKINADYHT
jgi:glutamate N-acetyltransferase/amino-acid N-acetyltransferase